MIQIIKILILMLKLQDFHPKLFHYLEIVINVGEIFPWDVSISIIGHSINIRVTGQVNHFQHPLNGKFKTKLDPFLSHLIIQELCFS